jgi:hypothetical protein
VQIIKLLNIMFTYSDKKTSNKIKVTGPRFEPGTFRIKKLQCYGFMNPHVSQANPTTLFTTR